MKHPEYEERAETAGKPTGKDAAPLQWTDRNHQWVTDAGLERLVRAFPDESANGVEGGRWLVEKSTAKRHPQRNPEELWGMYLKLVEIEESCRNLKSDLSVRPIWHWKESRVDAQIFLAFMAYCLHVCLKGHLKKVAGGLTPRAMLAKFARREWLIQRLALQRNFMKLNRG